MALTSLLSEYSITELPERHKSVKIKIFVAICRFQKYYRIIVSIGNKKTVAAYRGKRKRGGSNNENQ